MTIRGFYEWDELWQPYKLVEQSAGFEFPVELVERHTAAKEAFEAVCAEIKAIQRNSRSSPGTTRPS